MSSIWPVRGTANWKGKRDEQGGEAAFMDHAAVALGEPVPYTRVVEEGALHSDWPADADEIIYIDHFGNAYTGIQASQMDMDSVLSIAGHQITHGRTFSEVQMGEAFWYGNSLGLVEIAMRGGSAEKSLDLKLGTEISVLTAN